jgi:hopene-associated glycosyltransferase HpnB
LPWQPHRTRERLEPSGDASASVDLDNVAVLIPARNEAAVIERTLVSLGRQGRGLAVVLVDDQSTDGTAAVADRAAAAAASAPFGLRVVAGAALPPGWAGKLWALEQGLAHVDRPYLLLLDADIELGAGMLVALRAQLEARDAVLVSIMAELHCETFWERLLAPPFVLFFKLLYPFALANDEASRVAAGAGGCMFLRTSVLRDVGGFAAIRGALIDDCGLAAALKKRGRTWLGLSHAVRSHRAYGFCDFWRMVSRSAFTQLRYSALLLLATTAAMLVFFVAPVVALLAAPLAASVPAAAGLLGLAALAAASLAYRPIVRFYRLPAPWALTLAAAAVLFLAMTWDSALRYWRGTRATWKNRDYETTR